jgi:hypothetical protein
VGSFEVLASEAVTRLQLVEPRSGLIGIFWARVRLLVGFPKSLYLYFSAHALASYRLTSVTERFKCASDLGGAAFALVDRCTAQVGDVPRRARLDRALLALPIHDSSAF